MMRLLMRGNASASNAYLPGYIHLMMRLRARMEDAYASNAPPSRRRIASLSLSRFLFSFISWPAAYD